jgi:hypothetical protein
MSRPRIVETLSRYKSVLTLTGSKEYREWLDKLSEETLIPPTAIARDALRKWAEDRGFVTPPPRR